MASHPCVLALCRVCSTGRTCAATARWLADEIRTEETAVAHDVWLAEHWKRPQRPEGSYVDRDDPWPATPSGLLRDDPARDCS